MIYYSLALIFVGAGLFLNDSRWYIIAVAFYFIALFRKHLKIEDSLCPENSRIFKDIGCIRS